MLPIFSSDFLFLISKFLDYFPTEKEMIVANDMGWNKSHEHYEIFRGIIKWFLLNALIIMVKEK